jgi:hypothetical protein
MAIFKDAEKMYEVLGGCFKYAITETEFGDKMKEYDITYKFIMHEPEGFIWVSHDTVLTGKDADKDGIITMELSGDSAHKFWLKQLSLPVALATKKIKSKGPIPKVLKILPYLKPVYERYPKVAKENNLPI